MEHLSKKPVLGVLGGLGPLATVYFLDLLLRMTEAAVEQEHLDMIVYNFPSIPDRTGYILGHSTQSPLPGMMNAAQALADQGANPIVIPCVTAHHFFDDLQSSVSVPIINGVTETVAQLKRAGITAAGIMATDGTMVCGLFTRALEQAGIRPIVPSPERQADVMHLIYNNIKAEKPVEMDRFQSVTAQLRADGAQAIILGCTELSLIKRDYPIGPGFLDAMEVMAQVSVLRCGKKLKDEYRDLIS